MTSGLREGRFRLLYVAPERLVGEGRNGFVSLLGRQPPSFVAIDEAHCISQWGHDFRPEYRQLAPLRESLARASACTPSPPRRRRASDATSSPSSGCGSPSELVGSFDRPNLVYRVLARATLKRQLQDVLARHRGQAGIVYCQSRREVDALAAWLGRLACGAVPYHAGLDDDERHRHQDAFLNEDADVVVATVAFGMGIDRSDVRFVVHAGAPQSLEHYQQESGRAGRDGLEAECVLIYSAADFLKWRVMLEKNGELDRRAAGAAARHGAVRGERRLPPPAARRRTSASATTKDDCGACDYCLGELEAVPDPATLARKILSAVARVGQRFGAAHVANVLRGQRRRAGPRARARPV